MTRDQHLIFCQVCTLRSFNAQEGIICSLTNRKADFEGNCKTFTQEANTIIDRSEENNPYGNVQVAMASSGKRFANYIIDTLVAYALIFILAIGVVIVLAIVSPETVNGLDEESTGFSLLSSLLAIAVMTLYYTFMEAVFGRTIGKFITGTCVVDKSGKKPEPGVIFRRSLSRIVPFEAFSFLGSTARGWHDEWTDTWVVEKKYQRFSED